MASDKEKQVPEAELIARSLTIVDENGRHRIKMSASTDTGAQFQILSSRGCTAISIHVCDQSPTIVLHSPKGRVRMQIGCSDDSVGIFFHDSEGRHLALDGVDPNDKMRRILYDVGERDDEDGTPSDTKPEQPNKPGEGTA